jgi:hypothetical protein
VSPSEVQDNLSLVTRDARLPNQVTLSLNENIGIKPLWVGSQTFINVIFSFNPPHIVSVNYSFHEQNVENELPTSDFTHADNISITSSNKNSSVARIGDTISVFFTTNRPIIQSQASVEIVLPTIPSLDEGFIYTHPTVTLVNKNSYKAEMVVPLNALPGTVTFMLYNLMDDEQNSSIPDRYEVTTDGSTLQIIK